MEYSLLVSLIFLLRFALALILSAESSIKETKNAPFHASSGNEPLFVSEIRVPAVSISLFSKCELSGKNGFSSGLI